MSDDRYISKFPLPTLHDREILVILVEECSEVIKAATKLIRFGAGDAEPGQESTNAQRLAHEIGDLIETVALAIKSRLVTEDDIALGRVSKQKKLAKFMQTRAETPEGGR